MSAEPIAAADSGEADPHRGVKVYKTYKIRYFGLFSIVLLNIATGFVWLSYSSVATYAEDYLNCGSDTVNMTSIIYFICYVLMAPVSGWMFEKYGIKKSLIFGGVIQVIGSWLRYFADFIDSSPGHGGRRIALTLVGQVIASGAQPYFLGVVPKYAAVWFSENGRTTATMLGSVSNAFAAALAQLIIPVITTSGDTMSTTVLVCAILSTVAIIPAFFIQERPPTPPSASAEEALKETIEEPFWVLLKKVLVNTQFLMLMIVFGSFVAVFNSVTSLISQFTEPFGYSTDEAGYMGAAMVVAGLIGAGIAGPVIDKTKQYKSLIKTLVPITALSIVAFVFAVRRGDMGGIMAVSVIMGLSAFAVLPAALEMAVEMTYPVTPASSASILWAFGQLMGVIFLLILGKLQDDHLSATKNINPPLIFMAVWCVLVVIPVFMINSPYKRMEYEKQSRANDQLAYDQSTAVQVEEDKTYGLEESKA
ncbi:MFS transporter, FLVCR family, MFS-domain-containing protein 7 [Entomortierella parvispora]|uniref:MFS transporter, FLVCR family, MFS-domain-containing protein 7 n=1 Tax=Entomortierella parvispora TaxID=205924 RepID=A0A9P3M0L2_9FUNG|nr:MFS transporter, FLVCR family, MFS-domain-containing protein 7 [Entomortierella parvispora]